MRNATVLAALVLWSALSIVCLGWLASPAQQVFAAAGVLDKHELTLSDYLQAWADPLSLYGHSERALLVRIEQGGLSL